VPDCEATSIFEFHGLPDETGYATAEELAVVDAYFEDYAENKIVPYSPHIYRGIEYNCITRAFDFAKMDAALDYYLNNLSMNAAMIFHYGAGIMRTVIPLWIQYHSSSIL
jgi:hypothetical protein